MKVSIQDHEPMMKKRPKKISALVPWRGGQILEPPEEKGRGSDGKAKILNSS
jgi:hypothetical protein